MRQLITLLLLPIVFFISTSFRKDSYDNFKLYYSYAGLGSGLGSMQPKFIVTGKNYTYVLNQNSYYSNLERQPPKKICEGTLRTTAIDSIIAIAKEIRDTLVYKTNIHIMSGGIHTIGVQHERINVRFELHNAFDSRAQRIVDILNTNIPADKDKLWIFDFPETK